MPPDDLTVIWYTYSTIAQTLASAFGFLTAVCLYQVQSINGSLTWRAEDYLAGRVKNPPGRNVVYFLVRTGKFDEFRRHIATYGFVDYEPDAMRNVQLAL